MSHKDFETYGIYPEYTLNPKERKLRIAKVKKMRKAHIEKSKDYLMSF